MPKKAVKIPAARKSDGVRWTLQVSADATDKRARASATRAPKSPAKRSVAKSATSSAAKRQRKSPAARKPVASAPVVTRRAVPGPAATPAAAPAPARAPLPAATSTTSLAAGRRIASIAAASVLVLAAIAIMRDPSRGISATVNAHPATADSLEPMPMATATPQPAASAMARNIVPAKPVASSSIERRQPVTPARPDASAVTPKPSAAPAMPAPVTLPATPAANELAARTATPEPPAPVLASNVAAPAESLTASAVTITGCLEGTTDGDHFRLTDTQGAGAPTSRGWRSGFLKKRPAAVELVNVRDTSSLRKLVGHRVVTTGILDSRELSVRSVAAAGQTCD